MTQFYISATDAPGLARCEESIAARRPITITGIGADGHVHAYAGIVQSVEKNLGKDRHRVTMPNATVKD